MLISHLHIIGTAKHRDHLGEEAYPNFLLHLVTSTEKLVEKLPEQTAYPAHNNR